MNLDTAWTIWTAGRDRLRRTDAGAELPIEHLSLTCAEMEVASAAIVQATGLLPVAAVDLRRQSAVSSDRWHRP